MPEAFIEALKADPDGPSFLANVVGTADEGLLSTAQIADFFRRCAQARDGNPSARAMVHARAISIGGDGGTPLRRRHRAPADDGNRLSTVVDWQTWYLYHLDADRLATRVSHPLTSSPGAAEDPDALARFIAAVCAEPVWWQTGAHEACLGAPWAIEGSCWLSTHELDAGHGLPDEDRNGSAYQVASALGLVFAPDTWLLRYTVDAAQARAASGSAFGRPSFADGGNAWFRVRNPSTWGRHCAGRHWGNTTHVTRGGSATRDGRPERVVLRMPIGRLPGLQVSLLGKVQADAADSPVMGTTQLQDLVLNGSTLDTLVARLKSWLN